LCGAEMDAHAEDGTPLPGRRPVWVRSGTTLRIGGARRGLRACLAVAGGIAVPAVLACASAPLAPAPWALAASALPPYAEHPAVRVVRGREAERFEAASLEAFGLAAYRVTPQSDRMGCRLDGERLVLASPLEMISEAVTPGTVQVPPEGRPIALLADAQTTGGYPRIAHIAAVDLPLVTQVRLGGTLRFREIPLAEAQALFLHRELAFRQLEAAVRARIKSL
ncbi:KipI antagonist, partial [Paenibacillus filicis]|nr:KipI antagonist [Paenibacillus filicis]